MAKGVVSENRLCWGSKPRPAVDLCGDLPAQGWGTTQIQLDVRRTDENLLPTCNPLLGTGADPEPPKGPGDMSS